MMWFPHRHRNAGQTLVEMIVIIGIIMLLVSGIVAGTTVSFARVQDNTNRNSAIQYAQEAIEVVRHARDDGWNAFSALGTPKTFYCLSTNNDIAGSAGVCTGPNIENRFTRQVTLELVSPDKMSVDVTVSWGTAASQTVDLKTDLTNWR